MSTTTGRGAKRAGRSATNTNRNLLAALLIVAGAVLIAVSPVSADGEAVQCADLSFDFDTLGQGPLTKNNPTFGPVAVSVPAGTYDIILVSSDPTHAPGAYTDQMHESWFLVTDSGFTSPVTPDLADADLSTSIVINGINLGATTQITAVWAGQAPSFDSVHPAVTFRCVIEPSTTTTAGPTTTLPATSTTVPTTLPATSTIVPATTAPTTTGVVTSTTEGATSTTVAISTTTEGGIVGGLGSTTTTGLGQTGDGEDGTAGQDVLAYTGLKTNLAVAGVSLIAAGIALVVCGSYLDRRKLAVVHAAP